MYRDDRCQVDVRYTYIFHNMYIRQTYRLEMVGKLE